MADCAYGLRTYDAHGINHTTKDAPMPRTLSEIEAEIGYPPGDESLVLRSWSKDLIRKWLEAQGIDNSRTVAMREGTLYKAYTKPSYLRAILTRGDYAPGAQRTPTPATPVIYHHEHNTGALSPTPAPVMPDAGAAAQLASLIGQIAGGAVNEQRVIALIQEHAPRPQDRIVEREKIIIVEGNTPRELPDEPRHSAFADVLTAVAANIPVMLVGPAGAGKTTLCKQIATAMDKRFLHTGAVTSRYELSGYMDAHGNYQRTAFREAFEHGAHFLFDEVDGSDPSAFLWCNTALANGYCAFPDGNVERHDDFRIVAAANTFGKGADRVYVGRNALDGASLDRFVTMDFDYDEVLERRIFGDSDWTAYVQKVRRAVATLKLRHVVSPRATDFGHRLLSAGMPREAVETATLWKGLDAAQVQTIRNAL